MQANGAAQRLAGLTRLRVFLIGWVILYHLNLPLHVTDAWPWLGPLLWHGYLGVDGFFLLSGFALWLGYGARPPRGAAGIGRFLLRRVAKIWPLHLVALVGLALLVGALLAAGVTIRDPERFSARDFVLQLFLVHAWETTERFSWNYPSWALSVEWAGYLVFPALLAVLLRLPRPVLAAVPVAALAGLLAMTLTTVNFSLNHSLHLGLVRFFLEFTFGLALGRLATEGLLPRALPWLALPALPLGLLLGQDAATALGLAATIVAIWQAGQGEGQRQGQAAAVRPGLLLRLGEASFGIYLSWVFVEAVLVGLLRVVEPGPWGRAGIMLAALAATMALGWSAWRWVEVPAQRWVLERRRPAPVGLARPAAE
ncbi:acyltransferase family protein [Paracraurococcus lichenis]|uniref:Acyltransferase n=1 Tax=Paracraurococcus lichenis TaxID=3064888 RepID=A0ABT9DVH4_9PROT|nr:acyltransferase [Paracraurococcus sp. LOR1-02]MDO9707905.1 acyltransferase [Paracraurococcus sp. LOR1-02]